MLYCLLSQHNKEGFQPGPADPKFPKYLQKAFFAKPGLAVPAGLVKAQMYLLPKDQQKPKVISCICLHSYAQAA